MDQKGTFKVNCSVTDFPVMVALKTIFKKLSATGVDGIELVLGIKSRHNVKAVQKLAASFGLPIISAHQPMWSGTDFFLDEGFIRNLVNINVRTITFHPLPRHMFASARATKYFAWLSNMQEKYGITVCLENMPVKSSIPFADTIFPMSKDSCDLNEIWRIANDYNLKITYDASHALIEDPTTDYRFTQLLPRLGNVHLSSFSKIKQHLPLTMGNFAAKPFLSYLKQENYPGLITFEIYYPRLLSLRRFDFPVIKDSLTIVKSV